MLYDLALDIGSDYAHPVATGRHVLRVMPLVLPGRQNVERAALSIDPQPESRRDFTTFFGGEASGFVIRHPHQRLEARLRARVEVTAPAWQTGRTLAKAALPAALEAIASVAPDSPHHFTGPSPRLPPAGDAIRSYARESEGAGPEIHDIAFSLMRRIHRDFRYDGKATTVDTTAEEAFRLKRGVCQDFTHVMIAALRVLGIPAGYVSGYLRTLPPPGKPRLVGADAMHAWVRVWCGPQAGFIEYDPTNDMLAGEDHIVAGFGRDYADIAPLAGTLKGLGGQSGFQRVDISVV
ncbi:transglutaminase family protein [Gellertiella hungarica]|uniref:Transglutaminase-like putative cysteine protease n=1 Tax=Gellertiella hungarica TaxID=1572859 RepID=A0A7W6NI63_9HYPH|nr:transglutaminase family protein [Gellertiella hungarica]MBB4063050.1 transglutaminase-like putative cysteine protease [Gellertiella hungarica]